jgi:hypothetical protein
MTGTSETPTPIASTNRSAVITQNATSPIATAGQKRRTIAEAPGSASTRRLNRAVRPMMIGVSSQLSAGGYAGVMTSATTKPTVLTTVSTATARSVRS